MKNRFFKSVAEAKSAWETNNNILKKNMILEEFRNTENKLIRLVETCGFAGAPWKQEIGNIINTIRSAVKQLGPGNDEISFNLSDEITSQITFLTNLKIVCTGFLYKNGKKLPYDVGGETGSYKSLEITQKEGCECLDGIIINFYIAYDDNGKILNKNLEGTLSHEINHAYDILMRLKHNDLNKYNQSVKKYINFQTNNKNLFIIFYRLFSETEFNALISSVYSDLKKINSQRKNYQNDITLTQAYEIYDQIKWTYNDTINDLTEEELNQIKIHFQQYGIKLKCPKNASEKTFKRVLKLKIEFLLRKLFKNICRAASYYYDEVEKLQEQKQKQKILENFLGKKIHLSDVDNYLMPTGDNVK